MSYEREISFIRTLMSKYNVQTLVFKPDAPPTLDLGLRQSVHLLDLSEKAIRSIKPKTLYAFEDTLLCKYNAVLLPDTNEVLLIGPYLTQEVNEQVLVNLMEKRGIHASMLPFLKRYYAKLTVLLLNEGIILGVMDTLAETLWGAGSDYEKVSSVGGAVIDAFDHLNPEQANKTFTEAELRLMEERYAYEKQLMHAVANGMTHQAQLIISQIGVHVLEPRTVDPLRNIKNYGIVCNTLMRKAAEEGGVHPLHIDQLSSNMAGKLELVRTVQEGIKLFQTMVHKYCLLVRNHSMKNYSQLVQHVILRIEADLTADLSLAAHAAFLNVNSSYLSTLFKRETGLTLTEYVNRQRVEHGLFLLNATDMQIQSIAQQCGIPDVNYFTKIFKRLIGCTPKEYRRETRQSAGGHV